MSEEESLERYLDDEMEPKERQEFESALTHSPQLREKLDSLHALGEKLRGLKTEMPAELEGRLLSPPKTPHPRRYKHYFLWFGLVASALFFYTAILGSKPPGEFSLADVQPMVADHLESMPAKGTLQTDDPDRLASWLEPQVDFRPDIPRWSWAQLLSGRLCWIRSRKLARIRYRSQNQEFSVFVFPDSNDRPAQAQMVRNLQACYWAHGGLGYVVVMPVDLARLHPLAN